MCLGIPGQVVEHDGGEMGIVDVSGVRREVNLACVLGETPILGEWVLVHVGFAMSRIDAEEAADTLAALEALGEAMEEIEAIRASNEMLGAAR
ncbi:MAG: HypC/HybG/HupF family hydrogenase formation chaperone [Rubricella sp.]